MSKEGYLKLFSLEVTHSFFEKDSFCGVLFEPCVHTAELMERFGFIVKKEMNGFGIFYTSHQVLSSFLAYIKKLSHETAFDFKISTDDENFFLFTESPLNDKVHVNYSTSNITGVNADGAIVLPPVFSPSASNKTMAGEISVLFDDILAYKKQDSAVVFKIMFTARATRWQYYIINKSSLSIRNPVITTNAKIAFDGPFDVEVPSGERAMLFTSTEQSPLSAKPAFQLNLIAHIINNENESTQSEQQVLFSGLPWPDPGKIIIAELNGRQVFLSPVYIYL